MNKNTNNGIDRRKFNFNLLIVAMLIIVFSMQLYNQKLLLNMVGEINDLNNKIEAISTAIGIPLHNKD